jgi:hypothetical protein
MFEKNLVRFAVVFVASERVGEAFEKKYIRNAPRVRPFG